MSWTLATQLPPHVAEDDPREFHHCGRYLNTKASVLTFWDLVGFTAAKADDRYCPLAILKSAAWILTGSMSGLNGQPVKAGPKCFFFSARSQIISENGDTLIGWSVQLAATD